MVIAVKDMEEAYNLVKEESVGHVSTFPQKLLDYLKRNCWFKVTHQGIDYLFVSEINKKSFESNPEKYLPQYDGFCAVAASFNKVEELEAFDI